METKNVMIVGVGGQGSLLASKLLGRLLVDEGYDVKVSEVHGMSQRGGSVVTYVRFGDRVYSPVIEDGEADFIISFEKLEAARYVDKLKKDGTVVAVGWNEDGQCNVSDWKDIVAISAGYDHTVGLKKDGTVVANSNRQLSDLKDILPHKINS